MKLGLASPNRTSAYGTHDGEKRRERNRNGEVLKDSHDNRRKDKFITSSNVLIHIYDRGDEMIGKINGKNLYQRQKKMSTRLGD